MIGSKVNKTYDRLSHVVARRFQIATFRPLTACLLQGPVVRNTINLKGKYGLEKVSLNRKFFTCVVTLDHSLGRNACV